MRILNQYIFRQAVITTLIVTLVLTAVVWLTHSLRSMDLVINRGVSISSIMGLVLLLLPDVLSILLPISLFISVLVVLNRMQQDHETVVMGAVGLSPWQIAKPFIKVALWCSFVLCLISFLLLPLSFKQFKTLQLSYQNHYKTSLIQAGEFLNFNKVTVFVKERDAAGDVRGIFIYDGRNGDRPVTFTAGSGHLVESETGPKLILFDGTRQAIDGQNKGVSFLTFTQYVHELKRPADGENKRDKKPSECYIWELFGDNSQLSPEEQRKMRVEGNSRLLMPILPLVFSLIALSILLLIPYNRIMPSLPFVWATLCVLGVEIAMVTFLNYAGQKEGFIYMAYAAVFLPLVACILILGRHRGGLQQVRV
jgi:lipopolysaccharide export system permease protein